LPTINQVIDGGAARLREAAIEHDRRTAGVLLAHVLGVDRTHLLIKSETQVIESHYNSYLRLIERRAAGEPLQYITGHQEFYGLDFIVNPSVLIPRPETELLVDRVIDISKQFKEEPLLVGDIGTGSGCVAVAVTVHITRARVIATDFSPAAIDVARTNAERHGVTDRIRFLTGDLFKPFAERGLRGAISIFASNPPYVDREASNLIQREVHEWEPHDALFGGAEGLAFHRRLLQEGFEHAKAGGYLVFEIGYGQIDAITQMIADSAWTLIDVTRDLQGIPRTVTVRKPLERVGPGVAGRNIE
jgi:release factor glutamine methyltransferase